MLTQRKKTQPKIKVNYASTMKFVVVASLVAGTAGFGVRMARPAQSYARMSSVSMKLNSADSATALFASTTYAPVDKRQNGPIQALVEIFRNVVMLIINKLTSMKSVADDSLVSQSSALTVSEDTLKVFYPLRICRER